MRTFFLLIISASLTFRPLVAQQYVDLLRCSFLQTPFNTFDSSSASTRLQEFNADLTIPVRINERVALLSGASAEGFRARLDDSSDEVGNAFGLLVKAGCVIDHSERLKMTYMFLPRYSGNGGAWVKKDFQPGGLVLGKLRKSDTWTWQFGLMYNRELFGPFVVPLIGFYSKKPDSKWESNFLLPASADLNYSISSQWRAGASFLSAVRSYFMDNLNYYPQDTYWMKSTNEAYGYVHWEPIKGMVMQARCGYSVARKYSLYELNDKVDWALMAFKFGDDRRRINSDFSDSFIFQVRFIYRFYTD